jgi:hypothetical protein
VEHDACAIGRRFDEGDKAATGFACAGDGEACRLDQAIDANFEVAIIEDGEGEGEDALTVLRGISRCAFFGRWQ